jgi:hypothetical protein
LSSTESPVLNLREQPPARTGEATCHHLTFSPNPSFDPLKWSSRPEQTRISCHAARDKATYAPFSQGKAQEIRQRHQDPPEIREGAAEGPAFLLNIFRGLAGELWIDQAQERLTRLDAHVIANVDFGWGILGKLDKGGTIQLEQSDIGGGDWELTSLKLNLKGKALMLKSLDIQLTEQASHFSQVPPGTDYRKAIELLQSSGAPVAP